MVLPPLDFESSASADSATRAKREQVKIIALLSSFVN